MPDSVNDIRTFGDLAGFVHKLLCEKENLLADQFHLRQFELCRNKRLCGVQFSLRGPRNVRLGAIWAADQNTVLFYDAQGQRYLKVRLVNRLSSAPEAA